MLETAQTGLLSAADVIRAAPTQAAPNGLRYASFGDTQLSGPDIDQIVQAVPDSIAAALARRAYYFVPLTLSGDTETDPSDSVLRESAERPVLIASSYTDEFSDAAVCHRNAVLDGVHCLFVSTRLMQDRFALSFEFYINIGHQFVDTAGVPEDFMRLVWSQVESDVRGETSQDAWEGRAAAIGRNPTEPASATPAPAAWQSTLSRKRRQRVSDSAAPASGTMPGSPIPHSAIDEKARTEYFRAAFSDAIAIYLLSLTVDFDYTELREREYPLLAAHALAERLRHVARLFPPNAGQEFSIRYRRRNG